MSTSFTSLAIATGFERRYGVLKRLGASPLPRWGLLVGKVGALLIIEVVQLVVLGAVGARARLGPARRAPARRLAARGRCSAPPRSGRSACSSPARCAPRRRSPSPTSSTSCCSSAAGVVLPALGVPAPPTSLGCCRRVRWAGLRDALRRRTSPGATWSCCWRGRVVGSSHRRGRSRGSESAATWPRLQRPLALGRPLVANIGIVLTGGAVRLTGSGLGCPTWPRCTDESFVPHGALGVHGRSSSATGCSRSCSSPSPSRRWSRCGATGRRDLRLLALGPGARHPVPGRHRRHHRAHRPQPVDRLAAPAALDGADRPRCCSSRSRRPAAPLAADASPAVALTRVDVRGGWVVVYLGTVVTGSGPHAGDADSPRNGLDPPVSHVHAARCSCSSGLTVAAPRPARGRRPARPRAVAAARRRAAAGHDRLRAVLHRPARRARRPHLLGAAPVSALRHLGAARGALARRRG